MGFGLILIPLHESQRLDRGFRSRTELFVDADYQVLKQLGDVGESTKNVVIKCEEVPPGFKLNYTDALGHHAVETDVHGRRLTFTIASELQRVRLPKNTTAWNKAVAAFINALPPDTRVILLWT